MIKITKEERDEGCMCCTSKHDVYKVILGKDENYTHEIRLCPVCRKQLSNMLTKRVK